MYKPKDIKIKRGTSFLPNTSMRYLRGCYKKESDSRARDRLAAYMQRKEGLPMHVIAANLDRSPSSIFGWLLRAQEEGIRGRHERPGRGRKPMLDEDQRRQLVADLDAGPEACGLGAGAWSYPMIRMHAYKRFNVLYSPSGIQALMRGMGIPLYKPRPKGREAAPRERARRFRR